MGDLANLINAPIDVEIAGHKLKAKQISVSKILTAVTQGLKQLYPERDAIELQGEAEESCDSGRFPVPALPLLLHEALAPSGLDADDIEALMAASDDPQEYLRVIEYAVKVGEYVPNAESES